MAADVGGNVRDVWGDVKDLTASVVNVSAMAQPDTGLGNGSAFFNTSLWNDWAQGYATATSAKGLWLWNGVEDQLDAWDSAVMQRVEVLEDMVAETLTQTAVRMPWIPQVEEWMRGNEYAMRNYVMVQRYWHKLLLWGSPKWDRLELLAKQAGLPALYQRVLLNLTYFRLSYFKWVLCVSALGALFLSVWNHVLLMLLASLPAVIIRSNLQTYATLQVKAKTPHKMSNMITSGLSRFTAPPPDSAASAIIRNKQRRRAAPDNSRIAALLAGLALTWGTLCCTFAVEVVALLVVGHAVLHARQDRKPPAPRKALGGVKGMPVRVDVSLMDAFRPVPLAGPFLPPGQPSVTMGTQTMKDVKEEAVASGKSNSGPQERAS